MSEKQMSAVDTARARAKARLEERRSAASANTAADGSNSATVSAANGRNESNPAAARAASRGTLPDFAISMCLRVTPFICFVLKHGFRNDH
eukprot:SAG31_NODE_14197_length_822_cov_0.778700_2_plen_91_part_00